MFNPTQHAKERIIKTLQTFDFTLDQLGRIEEILNDKGEKLGRYIPSKLHIWFMGNKNP